MRRDIGQLSDRTYDVAVVGGGVLGGFVAWCAARRGYSVALLEKSDFASGTSSSSGKVLHGGIRYLQGPHLSLLGEAQREQEVVARLAPRLVRELPFLAVPERDSPFHALKLRGAAWAWGAYRRVAGNGLELSRPGYVTAGDGDTEGSWLHRLDRSGALEYSDVQLRSPERFVLALLRAAASRGAVVANYARVTGFRVEGSRVSGVRVRDDLSGERFTVGAREVVNATGAWAPGLERQVGTTRLRGTGFAKGTHVVLDRPEPEVALAIPVRERGPGSNGGTSTVRRVFVMPWEGYTLVGATYSRYSDRPDRCGPEPAEVRDLLTTVASQWPGLRLLECDPLHAYSGLYPIFDADSSTGGGFNASLRPRVVDHLEEDGLSGLISVVSVKLTTARSLARNVIEILDGRSRRSPGAPSSTEASGPLEHAHALPLPDRDRISEDLLEDRDAMEEMVAVAVEEEMALTLEDFLFRRTWIGHLGRPDAPWLRDVADWMGARLDWSPERRKRELTVVNTHYDWRTA